MEEPKSIIDELLEEYQTEDQKKEAIQFLMNIRDLEGWKIIKDVLERNIVDLTDIITDPPDGMKEKEINRLRGNVKLQKNFLILPDMLIDALSMKATKAEVDTSVYD